MKYPSHLLKVIQVLKRFPGVGMRSAERLAFNLLDWPEKELEEFCQIVRAIPQELKHCESCGCLTSEPACAFCTEPRQMNGYMCVIAHPRDAFAIEGTGEYKGLYHVLGGVLSPMEGINPDKLSLPLLKERIRTFQIREVIVALDSTLEGDATALYLKQELEPSGIHISRLAFGLPMGSTLDYVDGGTLARALSGRGRY